MKVPAELKYASSHEWLRLEEDGTVTIGITEHAQDLLGDIVFIELPKVGAKLAADDQAGVVESVKAASDLFCPIAGEVIEINEDLEGVPELANTEPYGGGWFFRIQPNDPTDLDTLMDAVAYAEEIGV